MTEDAQGATEAKVAKEVAEQEFERFLKTMELDIDVKGLDDEDRTAFFEAKTRIVNAICVGTLVVNDAGCPVFTDSDGGTPITFLEPTGAALMATDTKKQGHDVGKMFRFMAETTGESPERFAKMRNRDVKICMAIASLFFG